MKAKKEKKVKKMKVFIDSKFLTSGREVATYITRYKTPDETWLIPAVITYTPPSTLT